MNCPVDRIEAYLDEELDAAQIAEMERHLADCADCSAALAGLREQKRRIQAEAPYYDAPPGLERSLREALREEAEHDARPALREMPWRWMAIAASVLLAASVCWNVLQWRSRTPRNDIAEAVLAAHLRSLLGEHLLDVPSSDRHAVKPWFAGRLDFSPEVRDLAAEGFPLAGGRVEYLAGRRVAALIFRRRQHTINLFTWPDVSSGGETRLARDGYNLLQWTEGGMTYWAVSDVAAADLERLRELYAGGGTAGK
jgi:anti-sigma factor RsiW